MGTALARGIVRTLARVTRKDRNAWVAATEVWVREALVVICTIQHHAGRRKRESVCVCLNKCACVCVRVCVQQRHKLSAEPFRCVTETANRTSAEGSSLVGGANAVCIAVHVNSTSCIDGTALVRAVIVLAPFTRKPLWTTAHAHADNGVCVCVSVCVCA